jgi:hypothetical protein
VFFQQLALNVEAVSNKWSALGYWLMPIGQYAWGSTSVPSLNDVYGGDSLNTIGGDIAYNITPDLKLSLGYYYQNGDLNAVNDSGVKTRLAYNIANGVTVGFTYSYDAAFQSVATGDIKWRFGSKGYGSPKKQKPPVMPVIQALSASPANRDVRVHDLIINMTCDVQPNKNLTTCTTTNSTGQKETHYFPTSTFCYARNNYCK